MQNAQLLLNPLLHLAVIVPLLLIFMKERTRENYLRVVSIVSGYLVYYFALTLQSYFDCFNIIGGAWNWVTDKEARKLNVGGEVLAFVW